MKAAQVAQRYLLWLRFHGAHFPGLAKTTNNDHGVINVLNCALPAVLRPRGVDGAIFTSPGSRTDAGVHVMRAPVLVHAASTSSAASQLGETALKQQELLDALNSLLRTIEQSTLVCLDWHRVSPGFCARRHASYRRYIYRLRVARTANIFDQCRLSPTLACISEQRRAWTLTADFDVERAQAACAYLTGYHNMASFLRQSLRERAFSTHRISTLKYMELVRISKGEPYNDTPDELFDYYNVEVVAKGFLRQQVRRMVSVIVAYACRQIERDIIDRLFRYADPITYVQSRLRVAPSQGLYLVNVVYDPTMFVRPVPYVKHSWDLDDYNEDEARVRRLEYE